MAFTKFVIFPAAWENLCSFCSPYVFEGARRKVAPIARAINFIKKPLQWLFNCPQVHYISDEAGRVLWYKTQPSISIGLRIAGFFLSFLSSIALMLAHLLHAIQTPPLYKINNIQHSAPSTPSEIIMRRSYYRVRYQDLDNWRADIDRAIRQHDAPQLKWLFSFTGKGITEAKIEQYYDLLSYCQEGPMIFLDSEKEACLEHYIDYLEREAAHDFVHIHRPSTFSTSTIKALFGCLQDRDNLQALTLKVITHAELESSEPFASILHLNSHRHHDFDFMAHLSSMGIRAAARAGHSVKISNNIYSFVKLHHLAGATFSVPDMMELRIPFYVDPDSHTDFLGQPVHILPSQQIQDSLPNLTLSIAEYFCHAGHTKVWLDLCRTEHLPPIDLQPSNPFPTFAKLLGWECVHGQWQERDIALRSPIDIFTVSNSIYFNCSAQDCIDFLESITDTELLGSLWHIFLERSASGGATIPLALLDVERFPNHTLIEDPFSENVFSKVASNDTEHLPLLTQQVQGRYHLFYMEMLMIADNSGTEAMARAFSNAYARQFPGRALSEQRREQYLSIIEVMSQLLSLETILEESETQDNGVLQLRLINTLSAQEMENIVQKLGTITTWMGIYPGGPLSCLYSALIRLDEPSIAPIVEAFSAAFTQTYNALPLTDSNCPYTLASLLNSHLSIPFFWQNLSPNDRLAVLCQLENSVLPFPTSELAIQQPLDILPAFYRNHIPALLQTPTIDSILFSNALTDLEKQSYLDSLRHPSDIRVVIRNGYDWLFRAPVLLSPTLIGYIRTFILSHPLIALEAEFLDVGPESHLFSCLYSLGFSDALSMDTSLQTTNILNAISGHPNLKRCLKNRVSAIIGYKIGNNCLTAGDIAMADLYAIDYNTLLAAILPQEEYSPNVCARLIAANSLDTSMASELCHTDNRHSFFTVLQRVTSIELLQNDFLSGTCRTQGHSATTRFEAVLDKIAFLEEHPVGLHFPSIQLSEHVKVSPLVALALNSDTPKIQLVISRRVLALLALSQVSAEPLSFVSGEEHLANHPVQNESVRELLTYSQACQNRLQYVQPELSEVVISLFNLSSVDAKQALLSLWELYEATLPGTLMQEDTHGLRPINYAISNHSLEMVEAFVTVACSQRHAFRGMRDRTFWLSLLGEAAYHHNQTGRDDALEIRNLISRAPPLLNRQPADIEAFVPPYAPQLMYTRQASRCPSSSGSSVSPEVTTNDGVVHSSQSNSDVDSRLEEPCTDSQELLSNELITLR